MSIPDEEAKELRIINGWLVEAVDDCTCGTGPDGYYGHHEPGCGNYPLVKLDELDGWPTPKEYDQANIHQDAIEAAVHAYIIPRMHTNEALGEVRTNMTAALEYLALGLTSEAGEVAGKIKKAIRDGELPAGVRDELGDVLWYVAMLADESRTNSHTY